ncbi:YeeE/YedE family protein [Vibrio sp. E150_011]
MDFVFPWASLFGGMLLGVSATLLLLFNGKIAGISGIVSGVLTRRTGDVDWRWVFLVGMVLGGFAAGYFTHTVPVEMVVSLPFVLIAGLIVGLGTSLGNGCTSGHGICGMGRLSIRSIVATIVFMGIAMLTTFFILHVL